MRYELDPATDPLSLAADLGAIIASLYSGIEIRLQTEVARRAYLDIDRRLSGAEKLEAVAELRMLAESLVTRVDVAAVSAELLQVAGDQGAAVAGTHLVETMGATGAALPAGLSATGVAATAALAFELRNQLTSMHERILRFAPDLFQDIVARNTAALLLGSSTLQDVQRAVVHDLVQRGIDGFTDAGGRRWSVGAYAEMAVRTASMRAWNGAANARNPPSSRGGGLVTPIIGRTACDRCAAWRGKILALDGSSRGTREYPHAFLEGVVVSVEIAASYQEAVAAGLHHPNCGCVDVRVFPGLDIPVGSTHDPVLARAQRKLRYLERRVIDAKRRIATAPSPAIASEWKRTLAARQLAIRRHTAETGVTRRNHREQLQWAHGDAGNRRG